MDLTPDSLTHPTPCPQCGAGVAPGARFCGVCGVDLSFAALLAERNVLASIPAAPDAPLAAEALSSRIGDYLLQQGSITPAELEAALAHQALHTARGEYRSLGQTLIELRMLSREALDQALTQMMQGLQNALLASNRELEQRVHQRTQALQAALEKLTEINQLKANFVALAELWRDLQPGASAKAGRKSIKLTASLPTDLPPVLADREKLNWVLFQLLDNAIKFTTNEGAVRLSAASQSGQVRISVVDTGIGIPAERLSELYTPFHQLDGSSTRRYGGTGLGLALVQQILEAHGSGIEVDSPEGQGSAFYFDLPRA
ncbi:MAG: hypothetical protein HY784_02445 [Chloroflexi bacterium]|nr:hypothetical protein [Chloroflexota bacterium]